MEGVEQQGKRCYVRRKKLTEKAIAPQTQNDTIFSNLTVICTVDTKFVCGVHMPRYICKLHNQNIVITKTFLQMSPCILYIWSLNPIK